MKNSIKCCISCILPCGVLDVIRIVHSNGRVEEFSHAVLAAEILEANPKHVLRRASSSDGVVPRIVVVPPEAELRRGKIYFLTPVAAAETAPQKTQGRRKKRREGRSRSVDANAALESDQYLSEILSEKAASMPRERRRGRVGVWRPHLESISET